MTYGRTPDGALLASTSALPPGVVPITRDDYEDGVTAALAVHDQVVVDDQHRAAGQARLDLQALLVAGIPEDTARRLLGPAAAYLED